MTIGARPSVLFREREQPPSHGASRDFNGSEAEASDKGEAQANHGKLS